MTFVLFAAYILFIGIIVYIISKLSPRKEIETFKLGIDWHGVLDAKPETLAWLTRAVVNNGGEVHIITGMSWTPECEKRLKEWNVQWTHHLSIFDYHRSIDTPIVGFHERFKMLLGIRPKENIVKRIIFLFILTIH